MTQRRTDSLIAADVVQLLGTHGQAGQVLAQVVDGRVALAGNVPSAAVAAELRARIQALPGVIRVDDQLGIVLPGGAQELHRVEPDMPRSPMTRATARRR